MPVAQLNTARVPRPKLSLLQFFVATLPILILLIYFVIAATRMLNFPIYNLRMYKYATRQQILADFHDNILADGLLAIPDMLYIFFCVFLGSLTLLVYVVFFIPMRRKLMRRYLAKKPIAAKDYRWNKKSVGNDDSSKDCLISVLGNVAYYPPSGFFYRFFARCYHADYAILTYEYPKHLLSGKNDDPDKDSTKYMVEKRIRTFHPYHRERITVVLLSPQLLLSGLPLSDIQHDVATFSTPTTPAVDDSFQYQAFPPRNSLRKQQLGRDETCSLFVLTFAWIVFTILGALYMLHQIKALYYQLMDQQSTLKQMYYKDDYFQQYGYHKSGPVFFDLQNDRDLNYPFCRLMFYILFLGVAPLIALGGNILAWWNHYHWITSRGTVTARISADAYVPDVVTHEELEDDEHGRFCDRYPCVT